MAESVIGTMIAELEAEILLFRPQVEGMQDFQSLDVIAETQAALEPIVALYRERLVLMEETLRDLKALLAHGYPEDLPQQVSPVVYRDLQNNRDTISAAFSQFHTAALATNLNVTASTEPS